MFLMCFNRAMTQALLPTTCMTLLVLGAHKDVQEKVFHELQTIFGNESRPILGEDVQKMKYLECVIKETLRMLPVVWYMGRMTTEDIKLGIVTRY